MKTIKKLGTLFLVVCLIAMAAAGCGSGGKDPAAADAAGTQTSESSAASTAAAETSAATAAASGSLTATSEDSAEAVDLTAVGITDWAHWYGYDQKADGGSKIGNYTVLGTGAVTNYEDDPRQISWSDGAPTASGTNNTGIYVEGRGSGFSIDVPAGTAAHTLKVYVGGWQSSGMLMAHLSDGSAPDYTETTDQASDSFDRVYTLVFNAGSDGQTLNVKWLQASTDEGNVTLQAAALD